MSFTRQRIASLLIVALAAVAASAVEKPPVTPGVKPLPDTLPDAPGIMLSERTVYVPYDKLEAIFEKQGRGVFLPYKEFLELWNAAQPTTDDDNKPEPPVASVISGGAYSGVATDTMAVFDVTYAIQVIKDEPTEVVLPLKNVAVETVKLSNPRALFAARDAGYSLIAPGAGDYTITLRFSVRVQSAPGRRTISFGIPPAAVSRLELLLPEKDAVADIEPMMATTRTEPANGGTKLLAFIGNADTVTIRWTPSEGVEALGETKGEALLVAWQAIRLNLDERVLRLDADINFSIERNETDLFRIQLPADMRLLSVRGDNINNWVAAENGILTVKLHSPVKEKWSLSLRLERVFDQTPETLAMPFLQTLGVLRENGFIALTVAPGLRVRVTDAAGLSQVNASELPRDMRGNILAGYNYFGHPISLKTAIEKIQPLVLATVTTLATLGADEFVLEGRADYTIEKVGVFKLTLRVPAGWEAASIGSEATVEDFEIADAADGSGRDVSVSLRNRALGAFALPFKFIRADKVAEGEMTVRPVEAADAKRAQGLFGISAPKAFKLTTVSRDKATPTNARSMFGSGLVGALPADMDLPLAFSYAAPGASVKVLLEKRRAEIRATEQHSISVEDGGISMTHTLRHFIEFAGVDSVRFSVPSELDETMTITCADLKERKKIESVNGRTLWEIALQEKTLGDVSVIISHKRDLKGLQPEQPLTVSLPDVRSEGVDDRRGFVAVSKRTTLEIKPDAVNLEPVEPIKLPPELRAGDIYLAYEFFEPAYSLTLKLTRHNLLQPARTLIDLAQITIVVTEEKTARVLASLIVENPFGEQYLEIELPDGATLKHATVDGRTTTPNRRKEGGTLVKLEPNGPFQIDLNYEMPIGDGQPMGRCGELALQSPRIIGTAPDGGAAPVNRIELSLYLPDDYRYMSFSGTLHPRDLDAYPVSNTLAFVIDALGESGGARLVNPQTVTVRPPAFADFPTIGREYRFRTQSAVGTIKLTYYGEKTWQIICVVVFLAMIGLAYYLIKRRRIAGWKVVLALIILPTGLARLLSPEGSEPFHAAAAAGWITAIVLVGLKLWLKIIALRQSFRDRHSNDAFLRTDIATPLTDSVIPVKAGIQTADAGNAVITPDKAPEAKSDSDKGSDSNAKPGDN